VGCGRTSAVPSGLATFGVQPSVETLSYSRLSLRDTKAAVFPRGQYSPGVQQYDLWIMTNSWGEGRVEGERCSEKFRDIDADFWLSLRR